MLAALALFATVLCTSVVSGIFGMAGGLILMLILALWLPVPAAMVLHGVTQFFSNGWRAWLWRRWIDWRIVGLYILGALPATALPLIVAYVPDRKADDADRPRPRALCRAVAAEEPRARRHTGEPRRGLRFRSPARSSSPASPDPLMFVRSVTLDRRAVVATKATTQALSHTQGRLLRRAHRRHPRGRCRSLRRRRRRRHRHDTRRPDPGKALQRAIPPLDQIHRSRCRDDLDRPGRRAAGCGRSTRQHHLQHLPQAADPARRQSSPARRVRSSSADRNVANIAPRRSVSGPAA